MSSPARSTPTQSCTAAATNTTSVRPYSPLIHQCSPGTQTIRFNVYKDDSFKDLSGETSFANLASGL